MVFSSVVLPTPLRPTRACTPPLGDAQRRLEQHLDRAVRHVEILDDEQVAALLDRRPGACQPERRLAERLALAPVARRISSGRRSIVGADRLGADLAPQRPLLADVRGDGEQQDQTRDQPSAGARSGTPSAGRSRRTRMPTSTGASALALLWRTTSSDVPRPRRRGWSTSARAAFSGACGAIRHIAANVNAHEHERRVVERERQEEQREAGQPGAARRPRSARRACRGRSCSRPPIPTAARRRVRRGRAGSAPPAASDRVMSW